MLLRPGVRAFTHREQIMLFDLPAEMSSLSSVWQKPRKGLPLVIGNEDVSFGLGIDGAELARSDVSFTTDPLDVHPAGLAGLRALLDEDAKAGKRLRCRSDRSTDWDDEALGIAEQLPNATGPTEERVSAYAVRVSDDAFLGVVSFARRVTSISHPDGEFSQVAEAQGLALDRTGFVELELNVDLVYVRPRYRGKGYGYHLCEALRRTVEADIDAIAKTCTHDTVLRVRVAAEIATIAGQILLDHLAGAIDSDFEMEGMSRELENGRVLVFMDVEHDFEL